MNYEQFIFSMLECVREKLPETFLVEKQEILKNNGVIAVGLSVCRQGLIYLPLMLILPGFLGKLGIQIVQPIADIASTPLTDTGIPIFFGIVNREAIQ